MPAIVSALMCHAPIVVPDVVGARGEACAKSTAAMQQAARRLVRRSPDLVVVLSPHTPRLPRGFSVVAGARVTGDFSDFGAPRVRVDLPSSLQVQQDLARAAMEEGTSLEAIHVRRLDHGALVPLSFLVEAGWNGPTVVIGLPSGSADSSDPSEAELAALGRAIARASGDARWAVVASGDCSHRLIPGAHAGFHADAKHFDEALVRVVTGADDRALFHIDARLRDLAAEDVVDTVAIAAAATGNRAAGREVLSYEGPYGVGYLVAVLHDDEHDDRKLARGVEPETASTDERVLLDVARDALAAALEERPRRRFDTRCVDNHPCTGCFVTWRKNGELRGCVGRMSLRQGVVDDVAELAVQAAQSDPRFPPVRAGELPSLEAEVSLLSPSEPVEDRDELDPKVWGVEVTSGWRRGVLLPDIEGVDSVDEQLQIVLQKAGIRADEPYTLRKFRVHKVQRPL